MIKCDFCELYDPKKKKCFWETFSARESDCNTAIMRMMEVLKTEPIKKRKSWK